MSGGRIPLTHFRKELAFGHRSTRRRTALCALEHGTQCEIRRAMNLEALPSSKGNAPQLFAALQSDFASSRARLRSARVPHRFQDAGQESSCSTNDDIDLRSAAVMSNRCIFFCALLLSIVVSHTSYAQAISDYTIKSWSEQDGLPGGRVPSIAGDRD